MQDFLEFLENYRNKRSTGERISFHMPGHKGGYIYKKYGYDKLLKDVAEFDITEIFGADNLHSPETIIADLESKYEGLYNAKKSFLSINGSSASIMAAILTGIFMAQEQGARGRKRSEKPKLLMSRASHKSAYSALELADIEPVYLQPTYFKNCNIIGEVKATDIEQALKEDESIEAVFVTSPNYYGVCSDISKISEVVHRYGKILIVDQAHGAHLKFFGRFQDILKMPVAAEDSGADLVINSIHKTLASFTQTAVVNVMTDRIDVSLFREKLNLLQSTSPSYVLMSTLAINAKLIKEHGKEIFTDWVSNIKDFYIRIKDVIYKENLGIEIIDGGNLDKTKINIDLAGADISGKEIDEKLRSKGIYTELFTGNILMALSGIGNKKSDYDRLLDEIVEITKKAGRKESLQPCCKSKIFIPQKVNLQNKQAKIKKEFLELSACEGKISASSVIPYPPGIPLLCPGELIEKETIKAIKKCLTDGIKTVGIKEGKAIRVYKGE